jgi:hypothetical protein
VKVSPITSAVDVRCKMLPEHIIPECADLGGIEGSCESAWDARTPHPKRNGMRASENVRNYRFRMGRAWLWLACDHIIWDLTPLREETWIRMTACTENPLSRLPNCTTVLYCTVHDPFAAWRQVSRLPGGSMFKHDTLAIHKVLDRPERCVYDKQDPCEYIRDRV